MKMESIFNVNDTLWFALRDRHQDSILPGKVLSVYFSKQGSAESSVSYDIDVPGIGQIQVKEKECYLTPNAVADMLISKIMAELEKSIDRAHKERIMTQTTPKIGESVEGILNAWQELAEKPQHRKQEVIGIVGGFCEMVWRNGELCRIYPRSITYRPVTNIEKIRMYEEMRKGNFQVSTCEYGDHFDPYSPAYTELKIHHQATRIPLPEPPPLWCEDPANIFDNEEPDDSTET